MIVLDADVLGRGRTGEETYVLNLLRSLPAAAPELAFGAVTRHPELVPDGVEPIALPARSQEVRMAWLLPRLLRRLRPQLLHVQHALPLGWRGRSVVTLHDLHFERHPHVMSIADRVTFKAVVPRAARRADHVVAVSERTKRDAVELYHLPPEKIAVVPHGVDPAFGPGDVAGGGGFVLFVGAIQERKDPAAALAAARDVGVPLVVVGPQKDAALARRLAGDGADVRGFVPQEELVRLYRSAEALVLPSRYEGFGIPVLEAMASGTPVVCSDDEALREVAGDAGIYGDLASGIRRALAERERFARAGLERARSFTWAEAARRTADVYRQVLA
ncbi:MAG TPA: glycosyltransferase family 1 protein [Gaiellaceae bacterium]|nr:glycosyltransferase family 1 protein [Gaiellaceae bacterium]